MRAAACVLFALLSGQLPAGGEPVATERLRGVIVADWEFRVQSDPLFATRVGDHRYNGKLPAVGLAAAKRRFEHHRWVARELDALDSAVLAPSQRTNRDILARQARDAMAEYEFGTHRMPITNRSGFHVSFAQLPKNVPLNTVEDYENYIARLAAFGAYADGHIELMRSGIESGHVLPAVVLGGYEETIEPHIVADPAKSLLYAPFESFPVGVPESEHARLARAGRGAIADSVVPGYRRFAAFIDSEYLPAARKKIGASALPRGKAFYEHRIRRYTTLDLTPREIHDRGLAEVARIRGEMAEVIESVGFEGSFAEFLDFLRTDPRFYVETPEALLKEVGFVMKKMDGELPRLFGKLPRMPYGIRPVPDYIAPRTTTAYYEQPSGDGSKAGFYYVNTHNLKSRPLYEVEALSLHEAVPGHHLQLALQQELGGIPNFRRFGGFTAFVEGWALYAERLGKEVGFYEDPYSDFGRLTYEMWRACRLVVDSGIHYYGWSRRRAIDYMAENTALSLHNIETEVDRYISWPGQALAYKVGELKIRELRARAEAVLGTKFDVRRFHDVVLGSGSIPLDLLERIVEIHIAMSR